MCPSYLATRDEKDSTRGRARVLQEVLDGTLVARARPTRRSREALDLCLSCKGCASDCPTGVDMATYKAEALYQKLPRGRLPAAQPTTRSAGCRAGPRWPRRWRPAGQRGAAARAGGRGWPRRLAGIDQRRSLPRVRRRTTLPARGRRARRRAAPTGTTPSVLWVDTFTDHFSPEVGRAARRGARGGRVPGAVIPRRRPAAALTWITTGQLDERPDDRWRARVAALAPYVATGVPIVGLEPSCTGRAAQRRRASCTGDRRADARRRHARRSPSCSRDRGWSRPTSPACSVVAQPHCHHHAVMGWDADQRLLERAGATVTAVGGCCGLAGNFGMEKGHYEVSVAIAETHLLPAVRGPRQDAVVLADGMSCRVQLDDLAGVPAIHLAELLARRLDA